MPRPKNILEKIWDSHRVFQKEGYPDVLYIDAHFIHEVTSPQAFDVLRKKHLKVLRPKKTFAVADHTVPTIDWRGPIKSAKSARLINALIKNCRDFGVKNFFPLGHPYNGIVHVIGPELGISQPGMTIVCGDSHTSTHGALGSLAFGIGTSEVAQVLSSQCVLQYRPKTMKLKIEGKIGRGVTAKDIVLYIISKMSTSGARGYFIEYAGPVIRSLSVEARMTIANMSIEAGARGGIISPDKKTFAFLKGKPFAPRGRDWSRAVNFWKTLESDPGARYDKEINFDISGIEPMITYGTSPAMAVGISGRIPRAKDLEAGKERKALKRALKYMGFKEGEKMIGKKIDYIFIGSCTNSRLEDLLSASGIIKGRRVSPNVSVLVVPGSNKVKKEAEKLGVDRIFIKAGCQWRHPGCSACLAMNEDKIPTGKYCLSTSNRNFEGRQGPGARTILASPLTAAASAIKGKITDPREYL